MNEEGDNKSPHHLPQHHHVIRTVCAAGHLKRTLLISLAVGTWLVLFNLGDHLLRQDFGLTVWLKLALDYLTPFVVANMGLLSRKT
ncbi:MAG: hypothetical protein ACE5ET_08245 [Gammaproteobacteria bacterium]